LLAAVVVVKVLAVAVELVVIYLQLVLLAAVQHFPQL
jgi:hypothetical protein